jgi:hypothetical protein
MGAIDPFTQITFVQFLQNFSSLVVVQSTAMCIAVFIRPPMGILSEAPRPVF